MVRLRVRIRFSKLGDLRLIGLWLEQSLYDKVGEELKEMGYKIHVVPDWHYEMGAVCAIIRDPETGHLTAGADPRQENWADGM